MNETEVKVDEEAVQEIVDTGNICTYFQPVISLSTKSIIGFEAFSRGGSEDLCVIDPKMLFHEGLSPKLQVAVDRLCREKALKQFKAIHEKHKGLLLFLNINPAIFPYVEAADGYLQQQAASAEVSPENLVLECHVSCDHLESVAMFVKRYQPLGFKGCLDNIGVDDVFSRAISVAKPNFIKINQSFFAEAQRKDYSAKTLESILSVADSVGAKVIAQAVEKEDDSIRLLTSGVHLQQGFYYTKDDNVQDGDDPAAGFYKKINQTFDKYKVVKRTIVQRKKERFSSTFRTVTSICAKFSNMTEDRFEDGCRGILHKVDELISIFVLNNKGEQITPRVHARAAHSTINQEAILGMHKGIDHSAQDYVLYLDMGYERFISQPFVSPYDQSNACIISRPFFSGDGGRYMLCMELPYPG